MGAKKQFVLPSLFLLPHSLSSSPLSPSSTSSYFWLLVFFWLGTRIPKYTEIPALVAKLDVHCLAANVKDLLERQVRRLLQVHQQGCWGNIGSTLVPDDIPEGPIEGLCLGREEAKGTGQGSPIWSLHIQDVNLDKRSSHCFECAVCKKVGKHWYVAQSVDCSLVL